MQRGEVSALRPGIARLARTPPLLALAVVVVGVELVTAASQGIFFGKLGWRMHERPSRLVRNADLDTLTYFVPTAALARARELIPPGATYAIAVGEEPPVRDPELIRIVFKFWLLPRTFTERPADAQWVVAYHRPSETLGVPVQREIGVAPYVNVVQVRP
jgi:hypothetical protein